MDSPYFLHAHRPTSPVAEPSAIIVALRILRAANYVGTVTWGTDSSYALGIMIAGNSASAEISLVDVARRESREAYSRWSLLGGHTPAHIGFPPNECADVVARMGRLAFRTSDATANLLQNVSVIEAMPSPKIVLSVHHE